MSDKTQPETNLSLVETEESKFDKDLKESQDDTITQEEVETSKKEYEDFKDLFNNFEFKITNSSDTISMIIRHLTKDVKVTIRDSSALIKLYETVKDQQKSKSLTLDIHGLMVLHYFMNTVQLQGYNDAKSLGEINKCLEPQMLKAESMKKYLEELDFRQTNFAQGLRPFGEKPEYPKLED